MAFISYLKTLSLYKNDKYAVTVTVRLLFMRITSELCEFSES